ncbi:MAG: hypothetical protein SFU57_09275 [Gemmatimonadales bacterium]|nr:hypothetical protein [Gemmatimonadales bacterium]
MHDDWQDLLAGLHAAKARYLVVGAHAHYGAPPNPVDLLTSISGVPDFQAAWVDRVENDFGGVPGVALRPTFLTMVVDYDMIAR